MDNQTAIGWLSVCGIVTVVILLAALLIVRVLRSSVFGLASIVLKSVIDPAVDKSGSSRQAQTNERLDFRAAAQSVDFDAAVANRKGEATPSIRTNPATPTAELHADAFSATETTSLEPRKRRRIRDEQNADEDDGEVFESFLGD